MKCPKCNVDLRTSAPGEFGFVTLDICPDCDGIWFDKGELDRIDDSVWVDIENDITYREAEGGHKELSCPRCAHDLQPLSPLDMPALIIDRCSSCYGFWLDAGELEQMRDQVDHEHSKIWAEQPKWKKPNDWSWFRYAVYCFKTFK